MKFILTTGAASTEQQNLITGYLQDKGSWWHWFPDAWLFVANNASMTARSLRDELWASFKEKSMRPPPLMVLAVQVDSSNLNHWGGMNIPRDSKEDRSATDWLDQWWT